MLVEFGPDIWIADGAKVVADFGFHYPTRMAIVRLADRKLFVWSPIDLTTDLRAQVDAIGTVTYLVAPNSLHHLFIGDWKRTYPEADAYAAPKLREKCGNIAFDNNLEDYSNAPWSSEIDHVVFRGNLITTEVVFFHIKSGTVIFTDLVQQLPGEWLSGWRKIIARSDFLLGEEPMVPRKFRFAFIGRRVARAALQRILTWPADRVLMAHGTPVTQNAQAFLRRAFRWLSP